MTKINEPADAAQRRAAKPVICYEVGCLPEFDEKFYNQAREDMGEN